MIRQTGNSCIHGSPNVGNGNNVRYVNTSGAINNNNANNSNGVAPDCEKGQIGVGRKRQKPVRSRKERLSGPPGQGGEYTGADAVDSEGAGTAINSASPKDIICGFDELYKAAYICKRNVMWKDSVAGFIKNALINCIHLRKELLSGRYKLAKYSIFVVHEKKTRTIVATRMRDRVVQRSLCDNYLTEHLTRSFIYDNCACLPGRGTDMARNRLVCHMQRFYRKHRTEGYVLKIDIHDFFDSTPHAVAKAAVAKRVPDPWVREQVYTIIDSFNHISRDTGMGLGSQITQLVELAVLDDIDHYIKEKLRIKGYVGYMDDLILIHEDKEYLRKCLSEIEKMINALGLELNSKKTGIQSLKSGIHFLGFSHRLTDSGRVVKTLLHKKASKERRKLRKIARMVSDGKMTRKHADECYKAWRAHVMKGDTHGLLIKMDAYYQSLYEQEDTECLTTNR